MAITSRNMAYNCVTADIKVAIRTRDKDATSTKAHYNQSWNEVIMMQMWLK